MLLLLDIVLTFSTIVTVTDREIVARGSRIQHMRKEVIVHGKNLRISPFTFFYFYEFYLLKDWKKFAKLNTKYY